MDVAGDGVSQGLARAVARAAVHARRAVARSTLVPREAVAHARGTVADATVGALRVEVGLAVAGVEGAVGGLTAVQLGGVALPGPSTLLHGVQGVDATAVEGVVVVQVADGGVDVGRGTGAHALVA